MVKPGNYQTLLLDLDGTLVDSRADLAAAVNYTLIQLGYPVQTMDEIVPRIGNGLRQLLRESIQLNDPDLLEKAKGIFEDYYGDHCLDQTLLYDGVRDVMSLFSDKLKLAVVTNKPHAYAVKILDFLGLSSHLKAVVGGDSLPRAKPHPAPLLSAMETLKADPQTTLMVGDGIQDLMAAQAAHVKSCVVRYGFGFRQDLMDLKPDHVVDRFTDLKEIVI